MAEDIGTVINKGINTWKRNLSICFPFIFSMIATIIFSVLSVFIIVLLFVVPVLSYQNIDPENLSPDQLFAMFYDVLAENIIPAIAVSLILLIIYMLISAFFQAGAIGMAKAASEKGNTGLGDMISEGRKNFFNLFLVNILVLLAIVAGVIFLVPGILSVGDMSLFLSNPYSQTGTILLMGLGFILWMLYILILSMVLFLVNYSLVIDHLDPLGAVGKGISVFRHNIFSVFMLWLLIMGISVLLSVITEAVSGMQTLATVWSFLNFILGIIVIQPLEAVWITRFYLDRTGKKLYCFEDYILD